MYPGFNFFLLLSIFLVFLYVPHTSCDLEATSMKKNYNTPYMISISTYYMVSSTSRQDESNPALGLATREGKMELSCPLGTTSRFPPEKLPQKPYTKSFIDHACWVKMA